MEEGALSNIMESLINRKKYIDNKPAIQLDAAIKYVESNALRIRYSNSRCILFFVGIIFCMSIYLTARCLIKL